MSSLGTLPSRSRRTIAVLPALRCRIKARRCQRDAENASTVYERACWLDLADLWDEMADAFEADEQKRVVH
jgi:hypothetical protein